jgi:argininosuccinate lyase
MTTAPDGPLPGSLRGDDSKYTGSRRAGIRLTEPYDPRISRPTRVFPDEAEFVRGIHMYDRAQLVVLAEGNFMPRQSAAVCLRALGELDAAGLEKARRELGNGLHDAEAYLIRRFGMQVGGKIHLGRSTWDLERTGYAVRLREELLNTMQQLCDYRAALIAQATRHLNTVMPYYTIGQQAQPTTVAHRFHSYLCAAERDFQRLALTYAHMNASPAGTGAGVASRFDISRERLAELLGFDGASRNTQDPCFNNDRYWEMSATLACVMGSVGSLAADLMDWMREDLEFARCSDRFNGSSSILAQKRNPAALEGMVAIKEGMARRGIVGSLTFDLALELVDGSFRTNWALDLMADVLDSLTLDERRMLQVTAASWTQASDLAAMIVLERGLSWRIAHQIVAIMVRLAEEEGVRPGKATPELLDRAAVLFLGHRLELSEEAIAEALDPVNCIALRRVTGAPAPEEMARQL